MLTAISRTEVCKISSNTLYFQTESRENVVQHCGLYKISVKQACLIHLFIKTRNTATGIIIAQFYKSLREQHSFTSFQDTSIEQEQVELRFNISTDFIDVSYIYIIVENSLILKSLIKFGIILTKRFEEIYCYSVVFQSRQKVKAYNTP